MFNMEEFYIQVITTDGIVFREKLNQFLKYFFRTSTVYISGAGEIAETDLESLIGLFEDLQESFSYFEILRAYLYFHNENRITFEVPWVSLLC